MKKEAPSRAAGRRPGGEDAPATEDAGDSRSLEPQSEAEFWLHVASDGTEYRYDHERRDVRSLHVIVEAGFETTITRNIRSFEGVRCNPVAARPRGHGWVMVDDTSDNFTVWRRRVVAS